MFPTDNPYRDFDVHEAEQARAMIRFPVCAGCGMRIYDEMLYNFGGEFWCERCVDECHEYTENHMIEEEV